MNYGYDETTKGWKESRKLELAIALSTQLKIPLGHSEPHKPHIEIDQLYKGVRIRKITHLHETERKQLVTKADKIYCAVMGVK